LWGEELLQLLLFLDFGTRWDGHCHAEGSVSPRVNDPAMYWIGGWVDINAGLVTKARGKYFVSASDRTPVVQSIVRHYTDRATPEH
jgi:hypothetical protein